MLIGKKLSTFQRQCLFPTMDSDDGKRNCAPKVVILEIEKKFLMGTDFF
jgi:hypothetical protein